MTNLLKAMAGAAGVDRAGYDHDYSCRFNDDDSAYTVRTGGGAGDSAKTFTIFTCFKRGNITSLMQPISFDDGANADSFVLQLDANDKLRVYLVDTANTLTVDWTSTQVFRDVHGWYFITLTIDTTPVTPVLKVWNWSEEVTAWTKDTDTLAQNDTFAPGTSGSRYEVGSYENGSGRFFDGYIALHGYMDGVTITDPVTDSLIETDNNGVDRMVDVSSLSYGSEGHLLDFAVAPGTDDGAGTDVSGNDNHFTDSGLAANDQVTDTPTDNFATMNPLKRGTTLVFSEGNLAITGDNATNNTAATLNIPNKKIYIEATITDVATDDQYAIGVVDADYGIDVSLPAANPSAVFHWNNAGWATYQDGASQDSDNPNAQVNDVIQMAYDKATGDLWFGLNNSWIGTGSPEPDTGTDPTFTSVTSEEFRVYVLKASSTLELNFGQQDYTYTAPTDFLALSTANLTALSFDPAEHHQVELIDLTRIGDATGTVIGDMTNATASNDLANAFDGTTVSDDGANSASKRGTVTDAFAGKDWGSGVSKIITRFEVWDVNNAGYFDNTSEGKLHLYGSDSAPSDATDGTVLFSSAAFNSTVASQPKSYDHADGITISTAYRYHWVAFVPTSSASNVRCGEIRFYENYFTLNWNADTYDTLFIIKNRDNTEKWFWVDGLNGYNKYHSSDQSAQAQQPDSNVVSVSGTTITLGSTLANDNYVVECHRGGAAGGVTNTDGDNTTDTDTTVSVNSVTEFSIIQYTGTASANTFGHGLSVAPDFWTIFRDDTGANHAVYHSAIGNTGALRLDTTGTPSTDTSWWNDAGPNASVFSLGAPNTTTNNSGDTYTMYCWAAVEGYSAFGSYEGNNSPDGPVLNVGIKPTSAFMKKTGAGGTSWYKIDHKREGYNEANDVLWLDGDNDEDTTDEIDIISNGIKFRSAWTPVNVATTYIYGIWGTPTLNQSSTPAKAR